VKGKWGMKLGVGDREMEWMNEELRMDGVGVCFWSLHQDFGYDRVNWAYRLPVLAVLARYWLCRDRCFFSSNLYDMFGVVRRDAECEGGVGARTTSAILISRKKLERPNHRLLARATPQSPSKWLQSIICYEGWRQK
jgi:hypothetical protein